MKLTEIGRTKSPDEPAGKHFHMQKKESLIVIHDEFVDGLHGLLEFSHVHILFRSGDPEDYGNKILTDCAQVKGVFATRSPFRPSPIGMGTAKLLGIDGNILRVRGINAGNDCPVYDLKPFVPILDASEIESERLASLRKNPRSEFIQAICNGDRVRCLIKTAEIHGHFCPGSALGVMASLYGLSHSEMGFEFSEGMEDLMAVVEVNACFADGVQAVSGCTFGNNALVFRDLGRHAVTFAMRGREKGVRVSVRPDFRSRIDKAVPEFYPMMERVIMNREGSAEDEVLFKEKGREAAFAVLKLSFDELLKIETIVPDLPEYAPVTKSAICPDCGESIMITKTITDNNNRRLCRRCAGLAFAQIDGSGFVEKRAGDKHE